MSAFPWRRTADEKPEADRGLLVVVNGKLRDDVWYRAFRYGRMHLSDDGKMWRYKEDFYRRDRSAFVDKSFGAELRPSHWAYLSDVPLP